MKKKEWSMLWLDYHYVENYADRRFLSEIVTSGFGGGEPERGEVDDIITAHAEEELRTGLEELLGQPPVIRHIQENGAFQESGKAVDPALRVCRSGSLGKESYRFSRVEHEDTTYYCLEAGGASGLLYGVFHLLRTMALNRPLASAEGEFVPDNPLRMLDHWDNMDGSIERGYSGRSFFFRDNRILVSERTRDYARLSASVGINAVVINNVNVKDAASWLITERYYDDLAEMSEIFAGYGIRLFLSINFAAPMEIGGLPTADPLDPAVVAWWKERIDQTWRAVGHLGGFLVKADSEGRPGPFTYNRTHADGANMLADLVKPHDGCILWRCFVYNCTQDWRDRKTDRARAGYDNFIGLDGCFHDNVILQIKNGPMDFQIREPVSPLFGGLTRTNQMLEVQIAQEYTGQQIDLCYLVPMFREVLSFHTWCHGNQAGGADTVADIVSGRAFGQKTPGMWGITAVCNTGSDENWTGSDLAAANWYGFGRLAFQTSLDADTIAREWTGLTFRLDSLHTQQMTDMLLRSREIYEKYTSPLGIGWMVNPSFHYGPSVDGYEYSRWGTYHRADHLGIGVDRSDRGTGYALQYREPNASMYNDPKTCPEELLLFFHHLPYTYALSGNRTLIQHIYDTHFEGVEAVEEMIALFEGMRDEIEPERFARILERFHRQLDNAREWRDQVNSYFYRKSGIPDGKGRTIY